MKERENENGIEKSSTCQYAFLVRERDDCSYKKDLQKKPVTKETYKRDLQKRPTKETIDAAHANMLSW